MNDTVKNLWKIWKQRFS